MFKKPTWLRAVRDGVVDYSVLNKLLLPNMTPWFSYTHSTEMTLCAEIRHKDSITQHTGVIQGGVLTLGCETLACMAASLCVPKDRVVVATSINTHYMRPCAGTVELITNCLHSGATSQTWCVHIRDKSGKTCVSSTVDCAVIRRR